jgi:myo-inositol-1(or 4)-monophosphatase
MRQDYRNYGKFAEGVVTRAGKSLLEGFGDRLGERAKTDSRDIVTRADFTSQKLIKSAILDRYPGHGFLGEESGEGVGPVGGKDYTWIADPLDGTVNYAAGVPFWCVSLSVVDSAGEPVAAAVYAPALGELFTGSLGGGSFLNGRRLKVSRKALTDSLVGVGFSHNLVRARKAIKFITLIHPRVRRIRTFGSTCLDMCYTAAGRLGGSAYFSSSPWDVLAGKLLVEEAGGIVTGIRGERRLSPGSGVLAACPRIHPELLRFLAKV